VPANIDFVIKRSVNMFKPEELANELCCDCVDRPMEECCCGCLKKAIYNQYNEMNNELYKNNNMTGQEKIEEAIKLLENNGYIVKMFTKRMQLDADECERMEEKDEEKDCCGCSCNMCIVQ